MLILYISERGCGNEMTGVVDHVDKSIEERYVLIILVSIEVRCFAALSSPRQSLLLYKHHFSNTLSCPSSEEQSCFLPMSDSPIKRAI